MALECVKDVGKYIVTECLLPPVKRHINYWWCFDDNIQGLGEEIDRLNRKRLDIEQNIKEALLRAESPTANIQDWLEKSHQNLEEATRISPGDDLKAWHLFSRYTVGKNAKKMVEDLEKLGKDGDSIRIADPAPTPSMVSISDEPTMEFESRSRIEENIMEYLNDNHVCMIAICGAGGVGKTTMAKRIVNRVREDSIFDEVVMVVVSQQIDLSKIQKEVAELLGLKFSEDTLGARAAKLHTRLLDSKRKLIIFEDVWEKFDMSKIGVPFGNCSMRCKIILTSRVKDACEKMNAQVIPLDVLNEEEAWSLFIEKAGSYVESSDLRPIAKAVAAECKCLPIALVTVGGALTKDKSIQVWRDSLSQLERSLPSDIPGVIEDVYKPLKLSYDSLKNESLESLFLLCCLFPEDYDIPIEFLTLNGIGLGIFKGIRNIEEGRNRTYHFVEQLKNRFLLMNGSKCKEEKYYVKMHDVIRDVAIFIGSEEKHGFLKSLEVPSMDSSGKDSSHDCNWMSTDISIENTKLPLGLDFPNLRLLMILGSTKSVVDANVICFKGMEELNVLSLSRINLESLPPTLGLLKKLRTLHLHECRWLRDISLVGELANLQILCIQYCDDIKELPENIWRLNRLIFLELSYKEYSTTVVVLGAISSLIGLEELKIDCFDFKWEAKVNQKEERNGSLSVLESLPSLKSLEMHVSESNFVAQDIPSLSEKLVKYRICSGHFRHPSGDMKHERHIALDLPGDVRIGNWIRRLIRSTQSLQLRRGGSNNFNLAENTKLQVLTIWNNEDVEEILWGDEIRDQGERHIIFPELLCLELRNLPSLTTFCKGVESIKFPKLKAMKIGELARMNSLLPLMDSEATHDQHCLHFFCNQKVEIPGLEMLGLYFFPDNISKMWCRHVPVNFFRNLKVLEICNFDGISNLLSSSIAKNFENLDCLYILGCPEIFVVIEDEKEAFVTSLFPKLRKLQISYLGKLRSFCHGENAFELPSLQEVCIDGCPMMETFSLGSVSAPNLSRFLINKKPIGRKNLNEGIRDHFRTKDEDEDKDEDADEYFDDDEEEDEDEE